MVSEKGTNIEYQELIINHSHLNIVIENNNATYIVFFLNISPIIGDDTQYTLQKGCLIGR